MKDKGGESILVYGKVQKSLFLICGGGWGVSNALQVSMGVILNEVSQEWNITYIQQSLIPSSMMLGLFVSSFFWGIMSDKLGRMFAFQKVLLLIVLGLGIGIFSQNYWMLAITFIITGFGMGGSYTVDGNVFLEYCPIEKQYLLTGLSIFTIIGGAIVPGIAWAYEGLNLPYQWRLLLAVIAIVALGFSIPRFWIHETPTFLSSRGNVTKLYELIKKINPPEADDSLMDRIVQASPTQSPRAKGPKQQFTAMFSPPLIKYTVLYLIIWFGAGFTFTGIASFIPVLLNRAQSGLSDADVYAIMLGQQLTGFPGVFLATKLVNSSFGRKKTLFLGLFFGIVLVFGFIFINFYAVFVT